MSLRSPQLFLRQNSRRSDVVVSLYVWTLLIVIAGSTGCHTFRRTPVEDYIIQARELSFQGVDAMQDGEWGEAELLFQAAVETCPEDERARRYYAQTLMHRGEIDLAIGQMEKAVQLSGGDPKLLVELGRMLLKRGNLDEAVEQADAAIRGDKQLASAWALKAETWQMKNDPKNALSCFHRALSYDPKNLDVHIAIANLYQQTDRPHRALSTLESLAQNYPHQQQPASLLLQQGIVLKRIGRHRHAAERLAMSLERDSSSLAAIYHLSEAQLMSGDASNARITAMQGLDQHPADNDFRTLLARIDTIASNGDAVLPNR